MTLWMGDRLSVKRKALEADGQGPEMATLCGVASGSQGIRRDGAQYRRFETIVASLLVYSSVGIHIQARGELGWITQRFCHHRKKVSTLERLGNMGSSGEECTLGSASSVVVESKSIRRSRTWPHQKPKRDGHGSIASQREKSLVNSGSARRSSTQPAESRAVLCSWHAGKGTLLYTDAREMGGVAAQLGSLPEAKASLSQM